MKGKKEEVKHYDKRNAYQSGDFVFQNALPLAKEKFCSITCPLDTLEFSFANALHVERSLYWLMRMSANLANALIWLTYVRVFLLVFYVYEITIGPFLLAIR